MTHYITGFHYIKPSIPRFGVCVLEQRQPLPIFTAELRACLQTYQESWHISKGAAQVSRGT